MIIVERGVESVPVFIDLLEGAAQDLWDRGIHQWEPGSMRAQRAALEATIASGVLLLALRNVQPVGGCAITGSPYDAWMGRPGSATHLHKLVVARQAAASGIGGHLLGAAEDWGQRQGHQAIRLDCWDGNDVLKAYYRDYGFRELEAVPEHGYFVRLLEKPLDSRRM